MEPDQVLRTLVRSAETPSRMMSKMKVRSDVPIVDGSIFIHSKRLNFSRHAMGVQLVGLLTIEQNSKESACGVENEQRAAIRKPYEHEVPDRRAHFQFGAMRRRSRCQPYRTKREDPDSRQHSFRGMRRSHPTVRLSHFEIMEELSWKSASRSQSVGRSSLPQFSKQRKRKRLRLSHSFGCGRPRSTSPCAWRFRYVP